MKDRNFQETFLLIIFPLIMFVVCLIGSQVIMPENCYFYETRQIGFLCDSFELNNPQPCPICRDVMTATLARVLLALSIVFLLLPFAVGLIRARRNSIEKTNLFD